MDTLWFFVLVSLSLIVGFSILLFGWRDRQQRRLAGGIVVAPWVLVLLFAVILPGIDEWNPSIDSEAEVIGVWEGRGYEVELRAEGSFTAQLREDELEGEWQLLDWNLDLIGTGRDNRRLRFVEDGGELILLAEPPGGESSHPGPKLRKR